MQIAKEQSLAAWKNPYVSDGLVFMFDGIWNAGPGHHEEDPMFWKSAVGDITSNKIKRINDQQIYFLHWSKDSIVLENIDVSRYVSDNIGVTLSITKNVADVINSQNLQCEVVTRSFTWDPTRKNGWRILTILGWTNEKHGMYDGPFTATRNYPHGMKKFELNTMMNSQFSYAFRPGKVQAYFNGKAFGNLTDILPRATPINEGKDINLVKATVYGANFTELLNCRLYDRPLSADEITRNYEIDKERFGL